MKGRVPIASSPRNRGWSIIIYGASVVALSIAVGLLIDHVSAVLLSFLLAVSLLAIGVLTLKRELDKSRRDYKRLFDAVPCYICVLDRDLKILESNTLYRADFDVKNGAHCYEVCKKQDAQCPNCLVRKTFDDGRIHYSEETLTTCDGRELRLVVHSMPLRDSAGNISSVMEVFTDITDVKQLEKQLTLMGRAVAGMAHRIKNILMGLEGSIFVVNTGKEMHDEQMISDGWEMVERNVARVSRLVVDLLYCSKKREPRFKENVDPLHVAREVADLYRERMSDEGIELEMTLGEVRVNGLFDPDSLHNMLCNLMANAIDACRFDVESGKDKHTIALRCFQNEQNDLIYEVEDDGAGIPEDVKDKVFEDFFSTKGTEGTGMGLLVVQKVAEEHGGRVSFKTFPGKGTCFRVNLPADTPSEEIKQLSAGDNHD